MERSTDVGSSAKAALIARERRTFRWTCVWGTLGTILWFSRLSYLFWVQKQLSARFTKPDTPHADLVAFLEEVQKKAGLLQAAMIVAGILFLVCFVRWLLLIKRRRGP